MANEKPGFAADKRQKMLPWRLDGTVETCSSQTDVLAHAKGLEEDGL